MTQQQIKGQTGALGSNGSLDVYDVPGSAIITPYSVSATFDGSGAAGTFLPCLTFKTQTGAVIARCPAPEVAAGDTAEVSWFPHVGSGSGGGTTVTPAASCNLITTHSVSFTTPNSLNVAWGSFDTTDTTVFGTNPNGVLTTPPNNQPGDVNLMLLQDGAYIIEATVSWAGATTNAASTLQWFTGATYVGATQPPTTAEVVTLNPATLPSTPFATQDSRLFTVLYGPTAVYLLLEGGNATTTYTANPNIVAHFLGGGIGPNTFVY